MSTAGGQPRPGRPGTTEAQTGGDRGNGARAGAPPGEAPDLPEPSRPPEARSRRHVGWWVAAGLAALAIAALVLVRARGGGSDQAARPAGSGASAGGDRVVPVVLATVAATTVITVPQAR